MKVMTFTMVETVFSTHRIKSYLKKWALWWAITSETWNVEYLLRQFIKSCWDYRLGAFADDLLPSVTLSRTDDFAVGAGGNLVNPISAVFA